MASKYYVVWEGRSTGIFTDWNTCKKQVDGFAGAKYKSFKTHKEAEAAFDGNPGYSRKKKENGKQKSPSKSTLPTLDGEQVYKVSAAIKIFTDGACNPNPGKAGSGIAIYRNNIISDLWYGIYNPAGTNNTAELNALHQALMMSKLELESGNSVAVFCDSKYSIQCVTQWASGWEKKGWKKGGSEIKNLEIIKEMHGLYQSIKEKIDVFHVNGHVGVEGNELADRMSILAIEKQEENFCVYREKIDIEKILLMRAG
ncbi:MAG: viroplasmin family protein [Gammaproteobacteria bacterium]|nr:viroplasmin family protein [Gammaproteobacteria bacterium]MBQ0838790.1 viroplasmin family protein [Gammaproteobacteria bacterium]